MIFDIANFNKNAKKYAKAINYYDQILLNIDSNSDLYAEILYRRGGSYERSGDYKNADNDLLKSLEINPDDAYVLNYLAYSWLEREYKIDTALEMCTISQNILQHVIIAMAETLQLQELKQQFKLRNQFLT